MVKQTTQPRVQIATPKKPPVTTHYVSFTADVNPQTTQALLGLMGKLANDGVEHVHLLLSTPGGATTGGLTIYNELRGMPFRLTTHNVGAVNSIGNVVFLAGETRYSCPNATFMFHGVAINGKDGTRMDRGKLREQLQTVEADESQIMAIMAARTNIKSQELDQLFLGAMTRDPGYALKHGIIHEIKDVQIPKGSPFHQLVFRK